MLKTHRHGWTGLTSTAGEVGAEPAAGVAVGSAAREVNGPAQVLQPSHVAVRVGSLQYMCGVQGGAHAAVVQHHVAGLHAFSVFTGKQVLVEALELEAPRGPTAEDLAGDPGSTLQARLLHGHGSEVEHVVDGAEERGDLANIRGMQRHMCRNIYIYSIFK